MYRYRESGKHHLTHELILHDLKEQDKGAGILAVGMIVSSLAIALLFTAIMALISRSAGVGSKIICVVFWLCTAVIVFYAIALLYRARKPLKPSDIRVVKRRLDAIEQDKYPNAHEHVRGEARAVPRYLFVFEGMDPYHPNQTELALAEAGDEYYVVTRVQKPARPIRLYRADTYIWDESQDL